LSFTDIEPDGAGYKGSVQRETKGGIGNNLNKNSRLEEQRVSNFSLKGNHLIVSKLDLDWALAYSDAQELKPNERYIKFEAEDQSISLNIDNPYRPFAASEVDLSDFEFNTVTENRNFSREKETGARLNLKVPFSIINDQKGKLRFGGRVRLKNKEKLKDFFEYDPSSSSNDVYKDLNTLPSI
jgi:hypothetical protein